jgi:hypothetical protein
MPTKLSRCQAVRLFSAVLVSWVGSTVAARAQREPAQTERAKESAAATSEKALRREPWHLIHIPDPVVRRATIAALEAASARFADGDCRQIFTDFEDGNGRSLADRLSAVAVDIHAYLKMVTFIDDTRHKMCVTGVLAFTAPGSRVVRVCVDEFKRIYPEQPDYVVASIMHEILHTLGLGENPPTSRQITARVLARCGRKEAGPSPGQKGGTQEPRSPDPGFRIPDPDEYLGPF